MMAETLSRTDWLVFPLVTVVLFTTLFAATLAWIYRRGATDAYRRRSRMALEDGETREDRHG